MIRGNDSDAAWTALASEAPYYAVCTREEYRVSALSAGAREQFFESGARDVEFMLRFIRKHLDAPARFAHVLDYGCGVGRLHPELALQSDLLVGVDVSPAMLAEAAHTRSQFGLDNVQLVRANSCAALDERFDLVVTYLVLQHIPVARGLGIIRELTRALDERGVGMIHVTFARTERWKAALHWARANVPFGHLIANALLRAPLRKPLMQMNQYPLNRILSDLERQGMSEVHVAFTRHGPHQGALLCFRRSCTLAADTTFHDDGRP